MVINIGWAGSEWDDPVTQEHGYWKVFYDANASPVGPTQPIHNGGPNGRALEAYNPGAPFRLEVFRQDTQQWTSVRVPKGDTMLTAAQLASWGITQRSHIQVRTIPD